MPEIETVPFATYAGGTPNAVVDAVYVPTGGSTPRTIRQDLETVPNKLDAAALTSAAEKTGPVDNDAFIALDSAAGGAIRRITLGNIRAALKAVFDTLYAAASHVHSIANITGLQSALDGKANLSHTQAISTVTGLQAALDGKAALAHGHAVTDISGLQGTLNSLSSTDSSLQSQINNRMPLSPSVYDVGSTIFASGPNENPGAAVSGTSITITGAGGATFTLSGGNWINCGNAPGGQNLWRRVS